VTATIEKDVAKVKAGTTHATGEAAKAEKVEAAVVKTEQQIAKEIEEAAELGPSAMPGHEVKVTESGLLVRCTEHCQLLAQHYKVVLDANKDLRTKLNSLQKRAKSMKPKELKKAALELEEEILETAVRDAIRATGRDIKDVKGAMQAIKEHPEQLEKLFDINAVRTKEALKATGEEMLEGTHATGTTTKPRTATLTDAEQLAANLTKEIGPRPPGHEAHHIVPKGMKEADEARDILRDAGIGINDVENGIWLPRDTSVPNEVISEIHSKVHTKRAIRLITDQLREGAKGGPAGVRKALREIRRTLSDLKFER
jgi:hypothetical protein